MPHPLYDRREALKAIAGAIGAAATSGLPTTPPEVDFSKLGVLAPSSLGAPGIDTPEDAGWALQTAIKDAERATLKRNIAEALTREQGQRAAKARQQGIRQPPITDMPWLESHGVRDMTPARQMVRDAQGNWTIPQELISGQRAAKAGGTPPPTPPRPPTTSPGAPDPGRPRPSLAPIEDMSETDRLIDDLLNKRGNVTAPSRTDRGTLRPPGGPDLENFRQPLPPEPPLQGYNPTMRHDFTTDINQADRELLRQLRLSGDTKGLEAELARIRMTPSVVIPPPTPPPPPVMPWGKHKGVPLADVPEDYLNWILKNAENMSPELRAQIEQAQAARAAARPPPVPRRPAPITVMPWGKHKGMLFSDVPKGYLDWVLDNANIEDDELRSAIERERTIKRQAVANVDARLATETAANRRSMGQRFGRLSSQLRLPQIATGLRRALPFVSAIGTIGNTMEVAETAKLIAGALGQLDAEWMQRNLPDLAASNLPVETKRNAMKDYIQRQRALGVYEPGPPSSYDLDWLGRDTRPPQAQPRPQPVNRPVPPAQPAAPLPQPPAPVPEGPVIRSIFDEPQSRAPNAQDFYGDGPQFAGLNARAPQDYWPAASRGTACICNGVVRTA